MSDMLPDTAPDTSSAVAEHDAPKRKDEPVVSLSNNLVSYLAVALTFLVFGVLIGMALPDNSLNKDDVAQIVRDVLADANLGTTAVDRFELVDDDPYMGDEDAPIVIVEFGDFQCRYCEQYFKETLDPVLENYGQYIRFVYRDFAVIGPESFPSALAAHCAFDQGKFWEFHDSLYNNQDKLGRDFFLATAEEHELDIELFTKCLDDGKYIGEINSDIVDGQINGVSGTPAFFINGTPIRGAQPYEIFERLILRELKKAGIDPTQPS